MKSVVILPTYNEASNLPRLLPPVFAALPVDILVIDDNSPDGTGTWVEERAKENPRLFVMRRPAKLGLGSAYREGFLWAIARGYEAVFQMDSDFSHSPDDLPRLARQLEVCDLALGSRYVRGGRIEGWTFYRKWISALGNLYARLMLGCPVKDLTTGFKAWRASALGTFDLGSILSDGYAFQIETTWLAWRRGLKVTEVPIVFKDRIFGFSKLSKKIVWEAVWTVRRLRARRNTA